MVLTNDNKCFVIGRKEYGRLGLGDIKEDVDTLTPLAKLDGVKVIDIDCGDNNSFAVSEDGKAFVWGMGSSNQLGTGEDEDVLEPKLLVSAQVRDKKLLKVSGGGQHTLFVVHAEDTSDPEPEKKKKKTEETVTKPTEEPTTVPSPTKEPSPAKDPSPAKKRKGKAQGTNKIEKTNGNHTDKPEEKETAESGPSEKEEEKTDTQELAPEPDSTVSSSPAPEKVEEVKESASETGSTSSKGSKRGRKRKL